jgi:hypothetical protein
VVLLVLGVYTPLSACWYNLTEACLLLAGKCAIVIESQASSICRQETLSGGALLSW